MKDLKEKTIVTIKVELPREFANGLPEVFWTRLELIISSLFRLNQPHGSDVFPVVWKKD